MTIEPTPLAVERVACSNCDWEAEAGEGGLPVRNLFERVEPGDIMPFCECPECGALAYLQDKRETQ